MNTSETMTTSSLETLKAMVAGEVCVPGDGGFSRPPTWATAAPAPNSTDGYASSAPSGTRSRRPGRPPWPSSTSDPERPMAVAGDGALLSDLPAGALDSAGGVGRPGGRHTPAEHRAPATWAALCYPARLAFSVCPSGVQVGSRALAIGVRERVIARRGRIAHPECERSWTAAMRLCPLVPRRTVRLQRDRLSIAAGKIQTERTVHCRSSVQRMEPTSTTKIGAWETPIVFSDGWPLNADAWDAQMLFFGQQGYRVIAEDRRGHGRSSQTWDRNDYDSWADDLAGLIEQLDLTNVTLIAHFMGGGEIARYVGRHGTSRLVKMVFIGAVPPLMLKTDNNPGGLPLSVFDGLRAGLVENRPQFYKDTSTAFFSYNRPNAKVSEAVRGPVLAPRHAIGRQSVLRLHRPVLRNRLH